MNSLVLLIPLSILFLVGAGVALFWAVDHGQFDDMETGALLPMLDADRTPSEEALGEPIEPADQAERSR